MQGLEMLEKRLSSFSRCGERPSAGTLAYLLHESRPESFADSVEALDREEVLTIVAAEAACLYLAGMSTAAELMTVLKLLAEEEASEWAVR